MQWLSKLWRYFTHQHCSWCGTEQTEEFEDGAICDVCVNRPDGK